MDAVGELALLAELGVGFAGFVAIFLIFARREERFNAADSLRVRNIIMSSFHTVFGSLAPLAIRLYGISDSRLWFVSSILSLAFGLLTTLHAIRVAAAMSSADRAEIGPLFLAVAFGLGGAFFVALGVNAMGILGEPAAALYVTSLVCLLGLATSNFVSIAFRRLF